MTRATQRTFHLPAAAGPGLDSGTLFGVLSDASIMACRGSTMALPIGLQGDVPRVRDWPADVSRDRMRRAPTADSP